VLTHLQVSDFTLVEQLNIELGPGLTVLTGETGAGKSILLDALSLALGDRAEADKVRLGAARAEVSACFDVHNLPQVRDWLREAELSSQEECILRRLVTSEGRSKAFINGQPVTLTQLRSLGDLLLDIHSQHEHQSLLQTNTHRRLLDDFGQLHKCANLVKDHYVQWQQLAEKAARIRQNTEEINARYQLLKYQVEELDQLNLGEGELAELENRQRRMAHAVQIRQTYQQVCEICSDGEESVEDRLYFALQSLQQLSVKSARLTEVETMLQGALIQIQESSRELQRDLEANDDIGEDLPSLERRLSDIYDIARKHRIPAEDLVTLHTKLAAELAGMQSGDAQLEALDTACRQALDSYHQQAQKLSAGRSKAAKILAKAINAELQHLALGHSQFDIGLTELEGPGRFGQESVEFLISTLPGQPPKPLAKIASGGELSRISLAIQVVVAKTSVIPTLVFDEVDAGIGGTTGDVVGRMLRQLGDATQVICVTHLAQVASKAHQHLKVEKTIAKKSVHSTITPLVGETKVQEIARMMGGNSQQSLAYAREMLGVED
jgi:DNA repair protein RecN (Recombination protein N)